MNACKPEDNIRAKKRKISLSDDKETTETPDTTIDFQSYINGVKENNLSIIMELFC